jgi:hypothetical protein
MALASGIRLGPYEIVAPLGAGGMGEVYRARDTRLDRTVAIKVLPSSVSSDPELRQRFEREARAVSSLNHPHICALFDIGREGDADFMVLEYLEGETLAARLQRGPLPLDVALRYAAEVADALDAAHRKGVTHRDVKPGNILIAKSGVKLLDFGLAKLEQSPPRIAAQETRTSLTGIGIVVGTPQYMAPEQLEGKEADARTDIFGLGTVLYETISGKRAFEGNTPASLAAAILKDQPMPLSGGAGVSPPLERLIAKCLAKDPDERWQTARDLADEIRWVAKAPVISPQAAPAAGRAQRPVALLIGLSALVVALAAGWFWERRNRTEPPSWTATMLGGPAIALGPRISPDGKMLAFQAMVDGLNQVAVMKPETGNWTVLTRDRTRGLVEQIAWARDGAKIYYSRLTDTPRGIFSVPVLGGDERLVLENAAAPEPLPDGSLLFVRINAERKSQLFRFWPESGRIEGLPALVAWWDTASMRAFPDGKEVVFIGTPLGSPAGERMRPYILDLASGRARAVGGVQPHPTRASLTVLPDGKTFLIGTEAGNLFRVMEVPRYGSAPPRPVLTLTAPAEVDAAADGALYAGLYDRPIEVLRFPAAGGPPERVATDSSPTGAGIVALQDGRVLIPSVIGGRKRLVVVDRGKDLTPLVDTNEETTVPMTAVGARQVAFLIGSGREQQIAIASLADGRIVRRLKPPAGDLTSLGAAPDGNTLYCAASGTVWALSIAGGEPRRIHAGDSVAVDPRTGDLVVKLDEQESMRLLRVPPAGGTEVEIPIRSALRLVAQPLAPGSVGRDGRILVPAASQDSWFWQAAVLDPKTGRLEKIPIQGQADFHFLTWGSDGRVVGFALGVRSTLWRFRPESAGR